MSKVIIIPVHNQLGYLLKCIDTLLSKTYDFELIIVNDGSTDENTIEWFDNCKLNCVIINHEKALGFSKACNDGIDYAMKNFDFDCLCLLNSDTEIVTDNWFDKVESYFKMDKKIGVAGVVSNNACMQTVSNDYLINIDEKPMVCCNLIHGFCYFISKNLLMKIGRLDEDAFPHYGSEDDYSLKSIQHGFKNIVVGSVYVIHKGSSSYSKDKREVLVGKSLPDLIKRWGDEVKRSIDQTTEQIKKLNKL